MLLNHSHLELTILASYGKWVHPHSRNSDHSGAFLSDRIDRCGREFCFCQNTFLCFLTIPKTHNSLVLFWHESETSSPWDNFSVVSFLSGFGWLMVSSYFPLNWKCFLNVLTPHRSCGLRTASNVDAMVSAKYQQMLMSRSCEKREEILGENAKFCLW